MKHLAIIPSLFFLGFSCNAFAQDAAPVMYIPGMPVPQTSSAAPAAASADASADAPAQNNGKISRISKAGESRQQPQTIQTQPDQQPEPGRAEYKGVTPPKRLVPENANTFSRTSANQMSWIGFMPEDNQHRVFMQTSQPIAYQQIATSSDRIELLLLGTKLAVSNNQRELDMTYFKTPFKSAKASSAGKDTRVVIILKQPSPYEIKQHDNMLEVFVKPAQ